jgi:autotransporter-associated beta strand protein
MAITSGLRSLYNRFLLRNAGKSGRLAARKAGRQLRPWLEILEDRLAPATHTWTGLSATSSNWSDPANWDVAGPPVAGTLDNQLAFPAAAQLSNTNDINNLFASSISFTAPGYVLGGNVIALGGDTTISAAISSGTDTIALPIDQFYFSGGSDLSAYHYNHVIDVAGGGTLAVSGQINGFFADLNVGGVVFNPNLLRKTDAGALVLSNGTNSWSGDTFLDAGTLRQAAAGAIPNSTCVQVAAGAALDLGGFATSLGCVTGAGNISMATGSLTVGADNSSSTFSGVLSGAGGLTKVGNGTFTLARPNSYSGATSILAGTLAQGVDNAVPPSPCFVAAGAMFDLNGFNAALGSLTGGGTVSFPSSPVRTLTTGLDNSSTTFGGIIQGGLNLTKVGTGAFNLTSVNTYTGATTVSAGAMLVNGALAAVSPVTVSGSTAVLGGTGTVGAVFVSNGGTISPGNSPGILHTGPVTWGAGSAYRAELNGPNAGTGYDQLQVSGTADLSAGPALNLSLGFVPVAGQKFTILQANHVTGTFAGLQNGSAVVLGGLTFHIHYTPTSVFLTFGTDD